jgi:hypothetical protein
MPVFFLLTGLRTDWSVGGYAVFGAAALLLGRRFRQARRRSHCRQGLKWEKGEASVIGWLLQTKALIRSSSSTFCSTGTSLAGKPSRRRC